MLAKYQKRILKSNITFYEVTDVELLVLTATYLNRVHCSVAISSS